VGAGSEEFKNLDGAAHSYCSCALFRIFHQLPVELKSALANTPERFWSASVVGRSKSDAERLS
jgi:hypothetical protein